MAIRVEETIRENLASKVVDVVRKTIRDLTAFNPASVTAYIRRMPFLGLVLRVNVDMGGNVLVIPARVNVELTKRLSKSLGIPVLGYISNVNRVISVDVWFPTLTYRRGASWGFRRAIAEIIEEIVGEKLRWQEANLRINELINRYRSIIDTVSRTTKLIEGLKSIARYAR